MTQKIKGHKGDLKKCNHSVNCPPKYHYNDFMTLWVILDALIAIKPCLWQPEGYIIL